MKYSIPLLVSVIIIQTFPTELSIPGSVIGETISLNPNEIIRYRLPFVSDRLPYINTGLTFTFPFTFTDTPRICIGIQLPFAAPFVSTVSYAAIIESISTTSVTIRVTKAEYDGASLTTISEAATNEVDITIWALDNPF